MTMTLSGSGTIAGLVAGGLPDETITSADLASNAVNAQTLTLLNATGSAPVYACRAWVNFNGTGTVAIRASGNVSSITDNGTGDYTVNFTNAMPDANYSSVYGQGDANSGSGVVIRDAVAGPTFTRTTSAMRFQVTNAAITVYVDATNISISIFR